MKFLRSILSVLAGYVLFALSAFAFFQLTGQPPHQDAPVPVMLASIAVGMLGAFAGGALAAGLAGWRPFAHGIAVAVVLAAFALASLLATIGHGAIWSQLAALVLMAPSAVAGGAVVARSRRKAEAA